MRCGKCKKTIEFAAAYFDPFVRQYGVDYHFAAGMVLGQGAYSMTWREIQMAPICEDCA